MQSAFAKREFARMEARAKIEEDMFTRVPLSKTERRRQKATTRSVNSLSQMILDGKFEGILDQGAGCLIVYDDGAPNTMYKATLETISNMDRVVDSLMAKSSKIVA